jgi:hypothetical protein
MSPDVPYPRNTRVYRFGDAEQARQSAKPEPAVETVTEVPLAASARAVLQADTATPSLVATPKPAARAPTHPRKDATPWLLAGAVVGLVGDALLRRRRRRSS